MGFMFFFFLGHLDGLSNVGKCNDVSQDDVVY